MQEQATERTLLVGDLENALTRLEAALTDAGRAIVTIRGCVPQIGALIEVVNTMESAMTFARQRLGTGQPAQLPLHAVPQHQPLPAAAPQPLPQPEVAPEPEPAPQHDFPTEPAVTTTGAPQTYCLRLQIGSKVGALDLKAVDNAVNEQQSVTDVALIDYDGRQATLRVWISGTGDAEAARKALGESLRSRLGDADAADIDIEFEERAAA
jgi:hypothetical protein